MITREKLVYINNLEKCKKELKETKQQNYNQQGPDLIQRYDDMILEYDIYRSLIKLENDDLRYDLNKTIEERNNLMRELVNFKNLFNNINI
jgi:hypothetical protein